MKNRYILGFFLISTLLACKNDSKKEETVYPLDSVQTDTVVVKNNKEDLDFKKQQSITLKQEELKEKPDEKFQLEDLVISKSYQKETDFYTLDFQYPLLNEKIKASYVNFNEYIKDYYVDIAGTEASILEYSDMICDTIPSNKFQEKRKIDYKIYTITKQLVSVLFYKENFYGNTLHPSYAFDCLNFDLERAVFMNYEDFFLEGSEEDLRSILNDILTQKIAKGEMYYDCWEVSADDFFEFKNNFVVNDTYVEFYFDDCIMCPSYTGSYSIKIPLKRLLPVLRRYKQNPLFS